MKLITKFTDLLHNIARFILILLFILLLGFIIKWQVDAVNIKSTTRNNAHFSIIDEALKTKNDIQSIINPQEVKTAVVTEESTTNEPSQLSISIPQNTNVDQVADILLDNNLIQDKETFKVMVNDMELYNSFVPGNYLIDEDSKVLVTLLTITNRKYQEFEVTIVPEDNAASVGQKLQELGTIESAQAFEAECIKYNVADSFVPGKYTISTPLKVVKIIEKLTGKTLES